MPTPPTRASPTAAAEQEVVARAAEDHIARRRRPAPPPAVAGPRPASRHLVGCRRPRRRTTLRSPTARGVGHRTALGVTATHPRPGCRARRRRWRRCSRRRPPRPRSGWTAPLPASTESAYAAGMSSSRQRLLVDEGRRAGSRGRLGGRARARRPARIARTTRSRAIARPSVVRCTPSLSRTTTDSPAVAQPCGGTRCSARARARCRPRAPFRPPCGRPGRSRS